MADKEKIPTQEELVDKEIDEYYSKKGENPEDVKNKKANKHPIKSGEYAHRKMGL